MTELKNGVSFEIPIGRREAETPTEIFNEDIRIKKSCAPKYIPKSATSVPTNKQFRDLCGDTYKITLGYPMSFVEWRQLPSDDLKRIYIESMCEKYPGFSHQSLAKMLGISYATAVSEMKRLNINLNGNNANKSTMVAYNKEIANIIKKINDGELPKNLVITKNKKVGKLRRKNFDQIRDMELEDAKAYILAIYNEYDCALGRSEFAGFFGCGVASITRLFKDLGIRIPSGPAKSPSILAARERFRNEMLTMPVKKRGNGTHKTNSSKTNSRKKVEKISDSDVVVSETNSTESNTEEKEIISKFNIDSIDATIDSKDIVEFLSTYGFSGQIKIHVEKI